LISSYTGQNETPGLVFHGISLPEMLTLASLLNSKTSYCPVEKHRLRRPRHHCYRHYHLQVKAPDANLGRA